MKQRGRIYLMTLICVSLWSGMFFFGSRVCLGESGESGVYRVLSAGEKPADVRLGTLRTLEDYFPMKQVGSAAEWQTRAKELRRQVQVAVGLWPWPEKTPLNAVVHGKVIRDEYTVEKAYFESYPGFYVTGNLYRPQGREGTCPAVLCPHGHWDDGRFTRTEAEKLRDQIAAGAERFETGGSSFLQARCVQLARMGCVVFHYDMVGYADSVQLPHRPGAREAMSRSDRWGLFSPQAESRLIGLMGLQTWNSIRAVDFLCSLEDVDAGRIAVTGASGGGTQTFILSSLDDRIAVEVPAVMVSTGMQGGCGCENACYLRIGAGNVDIAGLFAPKPLCMIGADDWTREIETKGYPELQRLYEMLGKRENVYAKAFLQFGHNYNSVSRTVMYNWMNRHFQLGYVEPVLERDYTPLTREELSVWDGEHPRPSGDQTGDEFESRFLAGLAEKSDQQMEALIPNDLAELARYREIVGGAWQVLLGRKLEDVGEVKKRTVRTENHNGASVEYVLLNHTTAGEQLPAAAVRSKGGKRKWVIWLDKSGKRAVLEGILKNEEWMKKILAGGYNVIGADLLDQGEFLNEDGTAMSRFAFRKEGKKESDRYAAYTFGYNYSLFSQRVQDILTVVRHLQAVEGAEQICLAGLDSTVGPLAGAASAMCEGAVDRCAIFTDGFRFENVEKFEDARFLPGASKYLGLPGVLSLRAPYPLWIGEKAQGDSRAVPQAYLAAEKKENLSCAEVSSSDRESAAIAWLIR